MMRFSSFVSKSVSALTSISFFSTEISVVSITLRMKRTQARMRPALMATVRSKMTVRKNVSRRTKTSDLGLLSNALKVLQPLMLYATTIRTPARQAIGINLARGIRKSSIRRRTTAWTIPATGVRPPLLILVIVLAMAPVAGIPPKIGVTILAMPRAMSSVLELCLALIIPSATVAESRDSMAPSAAMVMAIGKRFFTASQSRAGISAFGRLALMENLSPMVSMQSTPANALSR